MLETINSRRRASMAVFAGVLAALLAISTSVYAQDKGKGGSVDPKAMQILKKMSDYLGQAKTFSFTVNTLYDHVQKSGIKIKQTARIRAVVDRSGRMYAHALRDDMSARRVWYDGKTLTRLDSRSKQVVQASFSGTIDKLVDHVLATSKMQLPVADFLYSDTAKVFGENLLSANYVGRRMVRGVVTHQLSFESSGADWQVWVKAGDTPIPVRFAIVYVHVKGEPQFLAQFRNWQFNMPVDSNLFAAKVPPDAKKVSHKDVTD